MKIIFCKEVKRLVGIFICSMVFGVFLFNFIIYLYSPKHVSIFSALTKIDKYEVRNQLLMEAMNEIGVCSPEKAAEVWGNGLEIRSAAIQYSVMTQKLKSEYAQQLEESSPNWITGMSSPWIQKFEIIKTAKPDENNYIFHLTFFTQSSTGLNGNHKAVITIIQEGEFWRISKIDADQGLYPYMGM